VTIPADGPTKTASEQKFFANAIGMGEIGVASDGEMLRTFVGSCIGVAIYNRRRKVAALAHIMLPQANGQTEQPGKYADTAIPEMIRQLNKLCHEEPTRWSAKIAGGAKMFAFQSGMTIGDQNVAAAEKILNELDIPVLASCCGGDQGRRLCLDVSTGMLTIESINAAPRQI
jgi:chemotaxis protein CheD